LQAIAGSVPDPLHLPSGCKFRNRCPLATEECGEREPELREVTPGHWVRCIHV
jgi:oligopeptide/dipeptide ABC transporter ATP-binding protein